MVNRIIIGALIAIAALFALSGSASAQCSGQPNANQICGGPTSGGAGLPSWRALVLADLPSPVGIVNGATPISGGTSGRMAYNNGGIYTEYVAGGDCTFTAPNFLCTKTNGVAFAASATTDATNATNIATGTLNSGRLDLATTANFQGGTANKVLAADRVFTSEVAVTFSATPTFDFSTFINASITLSANITSITFSNIKAGQAGVIRFIQSGAGNFTIPATVNANLKCPGGCNIVLTTGSATASDVLAYQCVSATYCIAGGLLKDVK